MPGNYLQRTERRKHEEKRQIIMKTWLYHYMMDIQGPPAESQALLFNPHSLFKIHFLLVVTLQHVYFLHNNLLSWACGMGGDIGLFLFMLLLRVRARRIPRTTCLKVNDNLAVSVGRKSNAAHLYFFGFTIEWRWTKLAYFFVAQCDTVQLRNVLAESWLFLRRLWDSKNCHQTVRDCQETAAPLSLKWIWSSPSKHDSSGGLSLGNSVNLNYFEWWFVSGIRSRQRLWV